ncbi:MAG: hypothetical protein B7Y41_06965 [Hydrogenophilales bacterium 28-61-23]|nr:MAG: hypothetical protein B7Y41_06965 [Hydrogenophilales bacterium 28-61-23]
MEGMEILGVTSYGGQSVQCPLTRPGTISIKPDSPRLRRFATFRRGHIFHRMHRRCWCRGHASGAAGLNTKHHKT